MWISSASLREPSDREVETFVATLGLRALSYTTPGMTLQSKTPSGYLRTDDRVPVVDRDAAIAAVRSWTMHDQGWARLQPDRPTIELGRDVTVIARAAGPWWMVPARVVIIVDEPDRWGFAYGTLDGHVTSGEELFIVEETTTGPQFRITAISRPIDPIARLGAPIIRRFQRKFVRRALDRISSASA